MLLAVNITCFAQADLLPEDSPVVASVIHGVKYPLANRFSLQLNVVNYYGDRLASTWGEGIEPRYNFTEKSWIALPIYTFQSQAVQGVQFNSGGSTTLVASDPSLMIGAAYGYNPLYGKFAIGESITHFRAGFNVGLMAVQMQDVLGNSSASRTQGSFSPALDAGLQAQVQFNLNWSAQLFSNAIVQQSDGIQTGNGKDYLVGWMYGLSLGRAY